MSLKNDILQQLLYCKGENVSGEKLAKRLGVSRAAVWKAVKALKEEGFDIVSATNRGYTLRSFADKTDEQSLSLELGLKVIYLECVSSTNSYARGLDERTPALIIADRQTDGKARHRETFPSPKDRGLYMSYLFFPEKEKADPTFLTARAVKAVADVLNGEAKEYEVYLNGKKVSGILTETTVNPDGVECAVIGIGVYTDELHVSRRKLITEITEKLKKF